MGAKGERTKAHIVERAAELFNARTYFGTSMSDLQAATSLEKGAIYNHFASKDAIAIEAFDFLIAKMNERYREVFRRHSASVDRLLGVLAAVAAVIGDDPAFRAGCPILNTAIVADDTHPPLRARARAAMSGLQSMLRRTVERGRERGEFRDDVDPEEIATVATAALEGAIMLAKLFDDRAPMERVVAHLNAYVRSLQAPAKGAATR